VYRDVSLIFPFGRPRCCQQPLARQETAVRACPPSGSLPTPEVLTIDNPGSARTGVTVSLATSGDGIEQVLSFDKVTIPAGSSTQQLKATGNFSMPLTSSTVPVTVTRSAAGNQLAQQVTTLRVLTPRIRLLSGPKIMPRDGQAEFEFAVTNPATLTYPHIYLALGADCGASGSSCHPGGNGLAGFSLAWLDGSTWQPLAVADNEAGPYGMVLRSGPLAPGTSIVRLRSRARAACGSPRPGRRPRRRAGRRARQSHRTCG